MGFSNGFVRFKTALFQNLGLVFSYFIFCKYFYILTKALAEVEVELVVGLGVVGTKDACRFIGLLVQGEMVAEYCC